MDRHLIQLSGSDQISNVWQNLDPSRLHISQWIEQLVTSGKFHLFSDNCGVNHADHSHWLLFSYYNGVV